MISLVQNKFEIISSEELDKQIEYSKNQAISKKNCEYEKEGQCSLGNMIWEEKFEDVEYKDINLTDNLIQVSNSINYFVINIKEEQIQIEKLEIIGENV